MQADPSLAAFGLRRGLAHVLLADLHRSLGDLDGGLIGVDVDEAPAQASQLARPQTAHEPREPHRRTRVRWDGLSQELLRLLDREALSSPGCLAGREQNVRGRVPLDSTLTNRELAGTVTVAPGGVDRGIGDASCRERG